MQLNTFLTELFEYNLTANKKILRKIRMLPEPAEAINFISHLALCQYKWLARITKDKNESQLDWWIPAIDLEQLENELEKSTKLWFNYIAKKTEEELLAEVRYFMQDGNESAATPKDIIIQLNFHSVHHRAQVQTIIRQQGLTPDFLDYIGTRFRKIKTE